MEQSVDRVGVIDKTVQLLDALSERPMSLTELAKVTGMPKPTVHRLCASLESHAVIVRAPGDLRRLGSRVTTWVGGASEGFASLIEVAEPVLRRLRDETGESVQLYVIEGDQRRCIAGLESAHGLRTIVRVGALLPLDAGSAGAVLRGDLATQGWAESVEEREKGVASVSAPVLRNGELLAAVSVSGPIDRTTRSPGRKYAKAVRDAAIQIAEKLAH